MKNSILIGLLLLLAVLTVNCGQTEENAPNKPNKYNGKYNSREESVLALEKKSGNALSGVLAIRLEPTDASIATATVASMLEIASRLDEAGTSVMVLHAPSSTDYLTGDFDLAIPAGSDEKKSRTENSGFNLAGAKSVQAHGQCSVSNMIVLYHVQNQSNKSSIGTIAHQELTFHSNKVSFRFRGLGLYQTVCISDQKALHESRAVVVTVQPGENIIIRKSDKDPQHPGIYRNYDPVVEELKRRQTQTNG